MGMDVWNLTPVSSVVIMDLDVILRGAHLTSLELIKNYLSIVYFTIILN
jgi:hypothetical protein